MRTTHSFSILTPAETVAAVLCNRTKSRIDSPDLAWWHEHSLAFCSTLGDTDKIHVPLPIRAHVTHVRKIVPPPLDLPKRDCASLTFRCSTCFVLMVSSGAANKTGKPEAVLDD